MSRFPPPSIRDAARGSQKRPAGEGAPGKLRAGPLIVAMALGGMAYGFAATMIMPALPEMQRALDASPTGIGWVLSIYLIASSVATGIIGRLGDVFGRRRTLVATLLVVAAGSALCAVAGTLWLVLVGRVVQGAGGAVYPLAYGILHERLGYARRASALGLMAATMGIGAGIGPVFGGLLADHAGYRWIFACIGALALVASLAVKRVVPAAPGSSRSTTRIDLPGALLLAATVAAPLIAVSQANAWGWLAPRTLVLFGLGAVLLCTFVAVERRVPQPLVSMPTMALPVVRWTNLAAVGYSAWAFGTMIAMTLIAQQESGSGYGLGATAAGLILIPQGLGTLLGGALTSRIGAVYGFRRPLIVGQAVGLAALVPFVWLYDVPAAAYVVSGVTGFGVGLALAATTNLVVAAVPGTETAAATGISTVVRNVGGAIGVQVTIALFSIGAMPGGEFGDTGLTIGIAALAGAAAAALLLALAVPRSGPRRRA